MVGFKPSSTFVARVMADVYAYEATTSHDNTRMQSLSFSRPTLYALTAGGVLLGVLNLIRIAFTLISPALCL